MKSTTKYVLGCVAVLIGVIGAPSCGGKTEDSDCVRLQKVARDAARDRAKSDWENAQYTFSNISDDATRRQLRQQADESRDSKIRAADSAYESGVAECKTIDATAVAATPTAESAYNEDDFLTEFRRLDSSGIETSDENVLYVGTSMCQSVAYDKRLGKTVDESLKEIDESLDGARRDNPPFAKQEELILSLLDVLCPDFLESDPSG